MTVTNATAWGAESDNNRSQASYYDLVTDARIAPKEAWSNLNPTRGPHESPDSADLRSPGWRWSLPLGVAILLAAVCGGLITVLAGTVRMFQLRRTAKKNLKVLSSRP